MYIKYTILPPPPHTDLCIFMSKETTANVHHKKLLRSCKRGHTWDHKIVVDVNKKKGVKVHAFLSPKIQETDGTETTKLSITANVKRRLLRKLRGCSKKCWVMVDTDVLDRGAGKSIHRTQGHPHPIDVDEGQVNFSQVLVPYEQVKECRCEHMALILKVTFVTAHTVFNFTEKSEDGFEIVEKE